MYKFESKNLKLKINNFIIIKLTRIISGYYDMPIYNAQRLLWLCLLNIISKVIWNNNNWVNKLLLLICWFIYFNTFWTVYDSHNIILTWFLCAFTTYISKASSQIFAAKQVSKQLQRKTRSMMNQFKSLKRIYFKSIKSVPSWRVHHTNAI